jgi:hypothetical protein
MTTSPQYLAHDDVRVAAILALAQFSAEYPAFDDAPLELAVAALLPEIESWQSVNTFRLIAGDLAAAIDYDTRGAEAVWELQGPGTDRAAADDWATDLRDQSRADARLAAEMLCSTQDALAVQS